IDGVDVALLVEGLGTDGLAPVGQDVRGQHVGGTFFPGGVQHANHAFDGLGGDVGAALGEFDQLLDEADHHSGLLGGTTDRELVATDVDVAVEGAFQRPEEFVTRTQQADHRVFVGHDDLDLCVPLRLRARCFGHGVAFRPPVPTLRSGRTLMGAHLLGSPTSLSDARENPVHHRSHVFSPAPRAVVRVYQGERPRARPRKGPGPRPEVPPNPIHPGGQLSPRPPRRWPCRWKTVCPPLPPVLNTSREPESATLSATATSCASRTISSMSPLSATAAEATSGWWSRGTTSTCVGACGLMSRKAMVRSPSRTISAGTSPLTILQKRQSVSDIAHLSVCVLQPPPVRRGRHRGWTAPIIPQRRASRAPGSPVCAGLWATGAIAMSLGNAVGFPPVRVRSFGYVCTRPPHVFGWKRTTTRERRGMPFRKPRDKGVRRTDVTTETMV